MRPCVCTFYTSTYAIALVFYFRLAALISESKVLEIVEMICWCLDDENIEVREMAAT